MVGDNKNKQHAAHGRHAIFHTWKTWSTYASYNKNPDESDAYIHICGLHEQIAFAILFIDISEYRQLISGKKFTFRSDTSIYEIKYSLVAWWFFEWRGLATSIRIRIVYTYTTRGSLYMYYYIYIRIRVFVSENSYEWSALFALLPVPRSACLPVELPADEGSPGKRKRERVSC